MTVAPKGEGGEGDGAQQQHEENRCEVRRGRRQLHTFERELGHVGIRACIAFK